MRRFVFGMLGGIVVAVVIAAAVAPLLLQSPLAQGFREQREESKEVRLASVTRGTVVRTINAPGEIEAETRVSISAQVSARVVGLPFDEGDRIAAGDVVVRLDDRDLRAALDAATSQKLADEARLLGAEADLDEARSEFDRQETLYGTNDASLASVQSARARLRRAESTVGQIRHGIAIAEARIRQAERDLDNTIITSPIDGVMTMLQAEVGELVVVGTLNNPGSVIMEIADLSRILVKTRIDESNIAFVDAGQRATVYLNAYPEQAFEGEVTFVGLARQLWRDGSGYIESEILLKDPNASRLQTGLTANVDIEVATLEDVLRVPSQSVVDRRVEDLPSEVVDGNPLADRKRTFARVVYVVGEDGKAHARPVEIGASDLTSTVIPNGLEEGERLVVGPFKVLADLKDGQSVREESETSESESDADAALAGGGE